MYEEAFIQCRPTLGILITDFMDYEDVATTMAILMWTDRILR